MFTLTEAILTVMYSLWFRNTYGRLLENRVKFYIFSYFQLPLNKYT